MTHAALLPCRCAAHARSGALMSARACGAFANNTGGAVGLFSTRAACVQTYLASEAAQRVKFAMALSTQWHPRLFDRACSPLFSNSDRASCFGHCTCYKWRTHCGANLQNLCRRSREVGAGRERTGRLLAFASVVSQLCTSSLLMHCSCAGAARC